MKTKTIILSIVAVIALVIMFIFIGQGVKNSAITHEENIENASSAIKVQEKRRYDLIPNLVECVKSYNEHEYNTLKDVIAQRGGVNADNAEEIKAIINAVAEAYPELKAQQNYQDLMNELALTENKIASMRDGYNKEVTLYNRFIRKFPNRQFLNLTNYEEKEYSRLEFENTSVDAPKVEF